MINDLFVADNANPPSRNNSSASLSSKASDEDQETESKMADQGSEVKRSDSPVSESTNSTTRTREARASDTTDGIRIKCREMLAKALRVSGGCTFMVKDRQIHLFDQNIHNKIVQFGDSFDIQ